MTPPAAPLLRSALFVPAANGRALAKSAALRPDALIFDLEDSAAPEEKERAREDLRAHLGALPPRGAHDPLRVVRINPLAEAAGTEDFLMARGRGADAVLLPKVEGAGGIEDAARALAETDAPPSIRLWAMVETPRGVARAGEIAEAGRASGRLEALVLGPNDLALAADLRPLPGRAQMMPWIGPLLVAGRAGGIAVLDGVFNDLGDAAGFAAECAQGRALGFHGKTLIHPAQIAPADAAFAPGAAEIREAEAIRDAFADPANAGRGVLRLDGRMVERLHLRRAEALLARAARIQAKEQDS